LCDDAAMPLVVFTVLVWLARRLRPLSLAIAAFETWRRLPPQHRRALALAARKNAPRVASAVARRTRSAR